jgi:hypothetical protein
VVATTEPRRDVIARTGKLVAVVAVVVGLVIVARVILVQDGWGDTGALHTFRHVGYVLTTPFHNLITSVHGTKARELVNDMLAVAVYVLAGLLLYRLLR